MTTMRRTKEEIEDTDCSVDYKVIIIGESRVGKTSIVNRLNNNKFQENTISTVGIDFVNVFYKIDNVRVKLQIWDTAGQERFRTITKSYFRNVKAIVLAFDLTEKESFEKLEYWFWSFSDSQLEDAIIYLVGNKLDLLSDREVTYIEAQKFADKNLFKYFETSAKTGYNLTTTFESLAFDLVDHNDMRLMDRYKFKSYQSNNDCFVYSYSMPAEINIKEVKFTKKKRRNLNRFLRIKQAKTNSTNTLQKYEITSKQAEETAKKKSRISTINLYDKDKILGSKKLKKLNCCKIS